MGEAVNKFMENADKAIRDMETGHWATMDLVAMRDAIAELATRIQVLEQDSKEVLTCMTDVTRAVREIGAMAQATHDITVDNSKRILAIARSN